MTNDIFLLTILLKQCWCPGHEENWYWQFYDKYEIHQWHSKRQRTKCLPLFTNLLLSWLIVIFSFIIHFSHTQWVLWMTYLSMGHVSRSLIPTHCERAGLWTHVPCWGFVNVCKLYLLFKQFTYIYKPPVLFCIPNIFPYYF